MGKIFDITGKTNILLATFCSVNSSNFDKLPIGYTVKNHVFDSYPSHLTFWGNKTTDKV